VLLRLGIRISGNNHKISDEEPVDTYIWGYVARCFAIFAVIPMFYLTNSELQVGDSRGAGACNRRARRAPGYPTRWQLITVDKIERY
jgi:hypothetical protein